MCECQGNPLARVTLVLGLPNLLVNRALAWFQVQSQKTKIGTRWVLVSDAICIGLKMVFLLTADEGIAVKALSSH